MIRPGIKFSLIHPGHRSPPSWSGFYPGNHLCRVVCGKQGGSHGEAKVPSKSNYRISEEHCELPRLTYSGRLTHISGHPSAAGRAWDRESSPVKDQRSNHCVTQPTQRVNMPPCAPTRDNVHVSCIYCPQSVNKMQPATADFAPGVAALANSTKQRWQMSDRCRHLANSTKHTRRLWFCPFALLRENKMSSIKPEIRNLSLCR